MQTIVVLGGGISGYMMARRLNMDHPELTVYLVDPTHVAESFKEMDTHPFHLHRPIPELSELSDLRAEKLKVGLLGAAGFTTTPSFGDINNYSAKVMGSIHVTNVNNIQDQTIYPITKQQLLMDLCTFKGTVWAARAVGIDLQRKVMKLQFSNSGPDELHYDVLVSTIALPQLLVLTGLVTGLQFSSVPFYTMGYEYPENTHMYQMLYVSSHRHNLTRVTLLGRWVFGELMYQDLTEEDADLLVHWYDLPRKSLEYVKPRFISPGRMKLLPQKDRKSLLHFLTEHHDIMCLGRYGAWTYKVANDVWDDTAFLSRIIANKKAASRFSKTLQHQEELPI